MSEHISTERMNESLDGLLSDVETTPIERHLEACAPCRNEYARLSETIKAVASLPKQAGVPESVWAEISERISGDVRGGAGDEVPVYRLPTAKRSVRSISFSVPQLAAAALFVSLLSAGIAWLAIEGGRAGGSIQVAVTAEGPGGAAARAVSLEDGRYAEVVDQLQQILEAGRGVLAWETLLTIEESLLALDAAIEEIETALAEDPNSDLLRRLLANRQRTKLGVLQRAAAAVQAQT